MVAMFDRYGSGPLRPDGRFRGPLAGHREGRWGGASELDDIRALRVDLAESLLALREAAAQQRSSFVCNRGTGCYGRSRWPISGLPKIPNTRATQLPISISYRNPRKIRRIPFRSYVAAFRLQRAEQIASRFGEPVKREMFSMVATKLKTVLGPTDRLLAMEGNVFRDVYQLHGAT